jgi:hypothetical protein
MTAASPPGRGRSNQRRYCVEDESGISPLRLFSDWLARAPGFARTAPPQPRVRVRFTCAACHAEVLQTASRCRCGALFYAPHP